MPGSATEIEFVLNDEIEHPEVISRDIESLIEELRVLAFIRVGAKRAGSAPAGSRSGDVELFYTILGLTTSPVVLKAAVDVAKSWLVRRTRGVLRVRVDNAEIELSAVSSSAEEALVKAFVERAFVERHANDASD